MSVPQEEIDKAEGPQPGEDTPDPLARIERLYDTPQDQWGVEQWREMSLYLFKELQDADAFAKELNSDNAKTLELAKQATSVAARRVRHTEVLRELAKAIADGSLKVTRKPLRKPPGRPKTMTLETATMYLRAASSFGGKAAVAERIAAHKLRAMRIPPGLLKSKKATEANKMSMATKLVKKHLIQTHGPGLSVFVEAKKLGIDSKLLWKSKQKK